ncbi:DedA family protein [Leptospira sp. GIMC2001]|uniref:DedA family protein n=1 Tax=Leptospira sp. GIMC2001 TaxID=1513297 RepID=UPI002349C79A|nr:VTT domain-containing protein [Leptospira sp. GIMC2001]WCL49453.1 VTT domain-containing protein [Leptospira sp. GIMC2001]
MIRLFGQQKTFFSKLLHKNNTPNLRMNEIFEYRLEEKKLNAVLLSISLIIILTLAVVIYWIDWENLLKGSIAGDIIEKIIESIRSKTFFGLFLTSFIGGWFFLFFPLEIYYFSIIPEANSYFTLFFGYYLGIVAAQTINYWFGLRANRICRILISPQNFYKMKGYLNKWGLWVIIVMNALPLPSPVFSTVLGAFRYNFARFFILMNIGAILLYSGMLVLYMIINEIGEENLSWIRF